MKTKISILLLFLSFVLASCGIERNILTQDASKFINKQTESPFLGNKDSKVQMMIFTDFQCPACIRFNNLIGGQLYEKYVATSKIGLTYKMYPLSFHKNAPEDALAALCANSSGKYHEFANGIYSLEEKKAGLVVSKDDRIDIAKKIGLDMVAFQKCIDDGNYVSKIKEDIATGDKIGVQGTPDVYINGERINYSSSEELFKIIDEFLK